MKAIVTVRLPRNPKHDPRNKQGGDCPLTKTLGYYTSCSDKTGEHHSYIEEGVNMDDIWQKAETKFKHVTRTESAEEWLESELNKLKEQLEIEKFVSKEMIKDRQKAEVANEAHIKLNAKLCDELQKSKDEVETLKKENAELERWGVRHRATIRDWGLKLNEAEAKLEGMTKKWDKEVNDNCNLISELGHAEMNLRSASNIFKELKAGWNQDPVLRDRLEKELEKVLDTKPSKWSVVELLQAVSLIIDPLSQELIRKAIEPGPNPEVNKT